MARWLVCGTRRSSGKTTFAIGLCAALARRGLSVQPFKKGPDYIDPMWLGRAAGRACRNLDPHLSGWDEVKATFARFSARAQFSVVEGNLGLHDGLATDGSDSNAALARELGLSAILLLDAHGTSRGIAPLALGQQAFDPTLRFAGVVLNRVGGARHEAKLRDAIERHTDLRVLGAIPQDASFEIAERHIGLVPSNESDDAARTIERLADAIERYTELSRLIAAGPAEARAFDPPLERVAHEPIARAAHEPIVRIAIARDQAFGFYYPDDLEALESAGAELVSFDALRDAALPRADGVVIGGGFPEALAAGLEANVALRADLKRKIDSGLPVYAECGGLMYLSRSIRWNAERYEMVGAIEADAVMRARAVGRGYVRLRETGLLPWPREDGRASDPAREGAGDTSDGRAQCAPDRAEIVAHEFHYSALEGLRDDTRYGFEVLRGHGIDGVHDGIVQGNLFACYAHQRNVGTNHWARRFVSFVRACKLRAADRAAEAPARAAPAGTPRALAADGLAE